MSPVLPRELHTTDRPSSTAQWTTFARALELGRPDRERIVTDRFAPVFLSRSGRQLLSSLLAAGAIVRTLERGRLASLATSVLCRHRFIDEQLLAALPDVAQIVILGAGYDTRAYRLSAAIGTRPVYEVDLAPLSRRKAAVVASRPDLFAPTSIERVEIDFRTETLADRLLSSGVVGDAPTFVAWEGVAMYLSRDAVVATLAALGELCGRGSVLTMDAWRRVRGLRPYNQVRRLGERAIRVVGEPLTFAVPPDELAVLLADAGFALADLATADELARLFATGGRRCDEGLYVLAARR